MTRPAFALLMAAIAIIAFLAMWWGWRGRARRDATVRGSATPPSGDVIAVFPRVSYVSTTPAGEPFSRVAAPGLRYRGPAAVTVRRDGVTIEVRGEAPVHLSRSMLRGSGSASARVGKAVERGGLALVCWHFAGRDLESSFRLDSPADQERFRAAIDAATAGARPDAPTSTQEDPR